LLYFSGDPVLTFFLGGRGKVEEDKKEPALKSARRKLTHLKDKTQI
jgi:hypothetical protein